MHQKDKYDNKNNFQVLIAVFVSFKVSLETNVNF